MKQHVTVIPSDGLISVDGEILFLDSLKKGTAEGGAQSSFHALQWHDGAGHVEPGDGRPNEELSADDYAGRVAPYVALWDGEKERRGAGAAAGEAYHAPANVEARKTAGQEEAEARALSSAILTARMQAGMVQSLAFSPAEFATFAKAGLFAAWTAGQTYPQGRRLVHGSIVYEVMQEVTALEDQPPDAAGMLSVYRPLSGDPADGAGADGSREHPYPFLCGMDVRNGCCYSHEGRLWLARAHMPACVRVPGTADLWQWEELPCA